MAFPVHENKNSSKTPNLLHRDGIFYFYCRIPSHLQHYFPHTENGNFQKHIKRSLKTKIYDEAVKRIVPLNAQYADLITVLEVKTMPTDTVRQHIRAFGYKYPGDEIPKPVQLYVAPKKANKFLLSELIALFIKEGLPGWTGRTPRIIAHALRLILYLLGDVPVAEITRDQCREARDAIFKLPPKMFTHKLLIDVSVETAIKYVEDGILKPCAYNTIKRNMVIFSSLMIFGINEGKINSNPVRGLFTEKKKKQRKQRRNLRNNLPKNARLPYDNEDLKKLLEHLNFDKKYPDRFWSFILALYAGLRIGEACQLYVDDIYQVDGVWVLDIDEKHEDQRVKTEAGLRIVPIHSAIIDLGFLWFVASVKKAGHQRLFPHLKYSEDDGYKRPAGNHWTRINVKVTGGFPISKKSFHSLRHNFLNNLKQARIFEPIASSIAGHSTDENITFSVYGEDYDAIQKKQVIEHVKYDCIDLPALRKRCLPNLDANYTPYYAGAENELYSS